MDKRAGLRAAAQAAVAVSWAFAVMAGVAALGLHLVGADRYGRLGPMTAAVVALGAGGSVTPTGSAEVFGASGAAGASGGLDIVPLGVALAGAAVLGWLFVRPLRGHVVLPLRELAVRAGSAAVCFLAVLGLLSWAGADSTTLDLGTAAGGGGSALGDVGSAGGLGGLLDPGKLGGLVGDLADPKATVGFSVRTAPTLLCGLLWVLLVLLLALTVSRRTPLPDGWQALHRTVRPVASALWTVLLAAVVAGAGAAVVLPLTEGSSPGTAAGGVLLGTPNGVGLAVPIGLGVPVRAQATGVLADVLPSPVDQLLSGGTAQDITVPRLMRLDGSLWALPVAAGLMLLLAGVLTAARTPRPVKGGAGSPLREALVQAGRLGVALAVGLTGLLALCRVSVNADLSVFGFAAVGAGARLAGNLPLAALYGLLWGAVAGFAGSLLVRRFAAAGRSGGAAGQPAGPPSAPRFPHPGSAYPGLPEPPAAPGITEADNPYRSGPGGPRHGGFNPYRDGSGHPHRADEPPDGEPPGGKPPV